MRPELRKNPLKKKIKAGKPVLGTFLFTPSTAMIEILAWAGYEFVIICTEHFMKNPETVEQMVVAAEAAGIVPLLRTQENPYLIERGLSVGCRGIMLPMCNTQEIAHQAINWAKYAPLGQRGLCMPRAVTYGVGGLTEMSQFFATENKETQLILQIESMEGVNNLDAILDLPGVDMVFAGPLDLSGSLGLPCQMDHPELEKVLERILQKAKAKKIPVGIAAADAALTKKRMAQGFDLITIASDAQFFANGAKTELDAVKGKV